MSEALILTGGGVKGAFQLGVLSYMSRMNIKPKGFNFVYGTSVGALAALALAHFEPGPNQVKQAAEKLFHIWGGIKNNRDIFKYKFPKYISGLWSPAVAELSPLHNLLIKNIDVSQIRSSGVDLHISAVDILTGELRIFTQKDPNLLLEALASASCPIFFSPVQIGNTWYVDGVVRDAQPLKGAIDNGQTKITIISCWNVWEMERLKTPPKNVLDMGLRCVNIFEHELLRRDILYCKKINNRVTDGLSSKKFIGLDIIYPKKDLGASFDFSGPRIKDLFLYGFNTGMSRYNPKLALRSGIHHVGRNKKILSR